MSERKRVNIKAILADPILREEIVEGATDFICKVEGIRPHLLSPAAQAVLDASMKHSGPAFEPVVRRLVAAALRAAALVCKRDSAILLSLADELKGAP